MNYEECIRRLEKILGHTSIFKNDLKRSRSPSLERKIKKPDPKKTRDSATQTDSDDSCDSSPVSRHCRKVRSSREQRISSENSTPVVAHLSNVNHFTKKLTLCFFKIL